MAQIEGLTPTQWVARRMRAVRAARGLSAADVAKRLKEQHGINWERTTVAKLESGKRENVSVAELLALALVLDVAPVHLLVPVEDDVAYQVTPGNKLPPVTALSRDVRNWVRGADTLGGEVGDVRAFWSEVPEAEFRQMFRPATVNRFSQPASIDDVDLEGDDQDGDSS